MTGVQSRCGVWWRGVALAAGPPHRASSRRRRGCCAAEGPPPFKIIRSVANPVRYQRPRVRSPRAHAARSCGRRPCQQRRRIRAGPPRWRRRCCGTHGATAPYRPSPPRPRATTPRHDPAPRHRATAPYRPSPPRHRATAPYRPIRGTAPHRRLGPADRPIYVGRGRQTAPRSAPDTRLAYLARAPVA
jgi:hypothetical protein